MLKHWALDNDPARFQHQADEFTNETLLRFDRDDLPISGLVGVYTQFWDQQEIVNASEFPGGVHPAFGPFTMGWDRTDLKDRKWGLGLFGEATWAITERLHLTAGIRYQKDGQRRSGLLNACPNFAALPPGVPTDSLCRPIPAHYKGTFSGILPKAGLAYDITDNLRVGVQASRGFHPGGSSTYSFPSSDAFQGMGSGYSDEELWNYEIFMRSSWLDRRLFLDANVFVTDFDDAQRNLWSYRVVGGEETFPYPDIPREPVQLEVQTPLAGGTRLVNVGDALSYGAELQATYTPVDAVSVYIGLGLLDTEIQDDATYGVVVGNRLETRSLKGKEFSRAPTVSLSFGLTVEPMTGLVLSI